MSQSRPHTPRPGGSPATKTTAGPGPSTPVTPAPVTGGCTSSAPPAAEPARSVQVHIQASLPLPVEDLVAALWVAAEHGELNPDRVQPGDDPGDLVRGTVFYLLLTDHEGIVAARRRLAAVRPGGRLWEAVERARAYAADVFTTPDPGWDLHDRHDGGTW